MGRDTKAASGPGCPGASARGGFSSGCAQAPHCGTVSPRTGSGTEDGPAANRPFDDLDADWLGLPADCRTLLAVGGIRWCGAFVVVLPRGAPLARRRGVSRNSGT